MKTRKELKTMAKQQIKGNIGILFVIMLIIGAITVAATVVLGMFTFGIGSLVSMIIITPAFTLSIIRVYQALANTGKKPEAKDAFSGFDDFWTAFKAMFLVGLFTYLWSLLFVIPGIIKSFSYSQTMLIVAENPGIGAREAISRSKAMMDGHKMDYFVLGLSFIGWALLCGITFGIAYIWVGPYMQATMVNFYNDVKPAETVAEEPAPAAVDAAPEQAS